MKLLNEILKSIGELIATPEFRSVYMGFISIVAAGLLVLALLCFLINRNFAKKYTNDVLITAGLALFASVSCMYIYDSLFA